MQTHRAFTLMELVVVIVIIAIVSTMAVPRYAEAIVRHRADAAARRLAADLNLARRQARVAGAQRAVTFDLATDQYKIVGMSHPDRPSAAFVVDLADDYGADLISTTFLPDDALIYDSYGMPDRWGSIILRVGDEYASVVVNATSGEAQTP